MTRNWRQLELFPYLSTLPPTEIGALFNTSRLYFLVHDSLAATGDLALIHDCMGNNRVASAGGRGELVCTANVAGAGDEFVPGSERWY